MIQLFNQKLYYLNSINDLLFKKIKNIHSITYYYYLGSLLNADGNKSIKCKAKTIFLWIFKQLDIFHWTVNNKLKKYYVWSRTKSFCILILIRKKKCYVMTFVILCCSLYFSVSIEILTVSTWRVSSNGIASFYSQAKQT